MRDVPNAVVHFYRATVLHADVWRQRLDATTNWAVVSTAALVTFSFSDPQNPHFILLLALVFDAFFLMMESRRYQVYDIWRHRVRALNRYIVVPALSAATADGEDAIEAGLSGLARKLGSTQPEMNVWDAIGYRLRRNYLFVFIVIVATWLLKLWYHPIQTTSFSQFVDHAKIGLLPGFVVLLTTAIFLGLSMILALRAPTERMEDWMALPSPMSRIIAEDSALLAPKRAFEAILPGEAREPGEGMEEKREDEEA